jgi:hypothetical protein
MGTILCPTHGASGISFVSPLVAEMVLDNRKPADAITEIILEVIPGKLWQHPVDSEFARFIQKRFALDGETIRVPHDENAIEEIYSMLTVVCSNCLSRWLKDIDTI